MKCNGKLWYSNINRFCSFDMFRNFVKNSFKSDLALKHAQDEVSAKKAPQKIRNRRLRRTRTGDDERDVPSVYRTRYSAHLQEIAVTTVEKTSVPDVRLSIPAVSCVATSASAGKPRPIFIK